MAGPAGRRDDLVQASRGFPSSPAPGVPGLVVAAYATAVGVLLAAYTLEVTVSWWPAAGIGLVAMLLTRPRRRVLVGVLLLAAWTAANATVGRPLRGAHPWWSS